MATIMQYLVLILLISSVIITDVVGETRHEVLKRMIYSVKDAKHNVAKRDIYQCVYYPPPKPAPEPIWILISFFNLLDLYWCQDPYARQSAANLQDQLRQLRPINKSS
ncbi:unnamed protein product [Rotaria sp. Silwood1]|nr:unnamed protein product [Rotaria sp. Silwood1]